MLLVLATMLLLAATPKPSRIAEPSYLPDAGASRVVTVTEGGTAAAGITVLTVAVAIKETGPRATVARFGEVYAFSPAFVASIVTSRPRSASGTSNPTTIMTSCSSALTPTC
jgi:hypothetical protein